MRDTFLKSLIFVVMSILMSAHHCYGLQLWTTESRRQVSEILSHAESGRLKELQDLLDSQPSLINVSDYYGRTLLFMAARGGHLPTVEYLLCKKGGLINRAAADRKSPLAGAVRHGHFCVVKYLVSKGGCIDVISIIQAFANPCVLEFLLSVPSLSAAERDEMLSRALFAAAFTGSSKAIPVLLKEGAECDALNGQQQSPLDIALRRGHFKIVHYLIKHDAFVSTEAERLLEIKFAQYYKKFYCPYVAKKKAALAAFYEHEELPRDLGLLITELIMCKGAGQGLA